MTLEHYIDGSVLSRTVTTPNQSTEVVKYSGGVVQFYLNSANQVTGTTQGLPGGVSVTNANNTTTTSFTSLQGNACLTVTGSTTTRTRFDPFGTPLTALPDTIPGSAEAGFGTVAGKLTDTLSSLGLIEMGARLYSTVLGRFLQVDPVPGGGVNAYSYPPDPVNMNDYSGKVGTADSYAIWTQHKANPKKDGNLRPRASNWAKLTVAQNIAMVASGASAALGVAAMVMLAVNPVGLATLAVGFGIASTIVGLLSTSIDCSADSTSFECISGMMTSAAGIAGAAMRTGSFAMKIAGGAIEGTSTWVGANLFGISLLRNSPSPQNSFTRSR